MAMPTEARLRAGASLMPSPTMHTGAPSRSRRSTAASLFWGRQSASTSTMPAWAAMWRAAWAWSPVSSTGSTPSVRMPRTAASAVGRTVSARAMNPAAWPSRAASTTVQPCSANGRAAACSASAPSTPSSASISRLPAATSRPATEARTPRPGTMSNDDGRASAGAAEAASAAAEASAVAASPGAAAARCSHPRTTALPRGCSLMLSALATREYSCSSSTFEPSIVPTATTSGRP